MRRVKFGSKSLQFEFWSTLYPNQNIRLGTREQFEILNLLPVGSGKPKVLFMLTLLQLDKMCSKQRKCSQTDCVIPPKSRCAATGQQRASFGTRHDLESHNHRLLYICVWKLIHYLFMNQFYNVGVTMAPPVFSVFRLFLTHLNWKITITSNKLYNRYKLLNVRCIRSLSVDQNLPCYPSLLFTS